MAQKNMIVLQNSETKETYYTSRNKKGDKADKKVELKKYSAKLKKHVLFKEIKGHPKKIKAVKPKASKKK